MKEIVKKENLDVILEDINGKFDLVLEGHESLRTEMRSYQKESNEKHDYTAFLIKTLNQKIDNVEENLDLKIDGVEANLAQKIAAVATDLSAHRRDTKAHQSRYQVRED